MKATQVRYLRLRSDINTNKAIKAIGISKSMIYKIELGYRFPSNKVVCRMSEVYHCSMDEIYRALRGNNSLN